MSNKQKTLIAALDWGLGHATRLVPIIRESERNGDEVVLASAGKAYDFWKEYFPVSETAAVSVFATRCGCFAFFKRSKVQKLVIHAKTSGRI